MANFGTEQNDNKPNPYQENFGFDEQNTGNQNTTIEDELPPPPEETTVILDQNQSLGNTGLPSPIKQQQENKPKSEEKSEKSTKKEVDTSASNTSEEKEEEGNLTFKKPLANTAVISKKNQPLEDQILLFDPEENQALNPQNNKDNHQKVSQENQAFTLESRKLAIRGAWVNFTKSVHSDQDQEKSALTLLAYANYWRQDITKIYGNQRDNNTEQNLYGLLQNSTINIENNSAKEVANLMFDQDAAAIINKSANPAATLKALLIMPDHVEKLSTDKRTYAAIVKDSYETIDTDNSLDDTEKTKLKMLYLDAVRHHLQHEISKTKDTGKQSQMEDAIQLAAFYRLMPTAQNEPATPVVNGYTQHNHLLNEMTVDTKFLQEEERAEDNTEISLNKLYDNVVKARHKITKELREETPDLEKLKETLNLAEGKLAHYEEQERNARAILIKQANFNNKSLADQPIKLATDEDETTSKTVLEIVGLEFIEKRLPKAIIDILKTQEKPLVTPVLESHEEIEQEQAPTENSQILKNTANFLDAYFKDDSKALVYLLKHAAKNTDLLNEKNLDPIIDAFKKIARSARGKSIVAYINLLRNELEVINQVLDDKSRKKLLDEIYFPKSSDVNNPSFYNSSRQGKNQISDFLSMEDVAEIKAIFATQVNANLKNGFDENLQSQVLALASFNEHDELARFDGAYINSVSSNESLSDRRYQAMSKQYRILGLFKTNSIFFAFTAMAAGIIIAASIYLGLGDLVSALAYGGATFAGGLFISLNLSWQTDQLKKGVARATTGVKRDDEVEEKAASIKLIAARFAAASIITGIAIGVGTFFGAGDWAVGLVAGVIAGAIALVLSTTAAWHMNQARKVEEGELTNTQLALNLALQAIPQLLSFVLLKAPQFLLLTTPKFVIEKFAPRNKWSKAIFTTLAGVVGIGLTLLLSNAISIPGLDTAAKSAFGFMSPAIAAIAAFGSLIAIPAIMRFGEWLVETRFGFGKPLKATDQDEKNGIDLIEENSVKSMLQKGSYEPTIEDVMLHDLQPVRKSQLKKWYPTDKAADTISNRWQELQKGWNDFKDTPAEFIRDKASIKHSIN